MLHPHRHRDRHVFTKEPQALVRGHFILHQDDTVVGLLLDRHS